MSKLSAGQEEGLLRILGCTQNCFATPDIVKNLKLLKENGFVPFSINEKKVMRTKGDRHLVTPVAKALQRIEAGEFLVDTFLDAVDGKQ